MKKKFKLNFKLRSFIYERIFNKKKKVFKLKKKQVTQSYLLSLRNLLFLLNYSIYFKFYMIIILNLKL